MTRTPVIEIDVDDAQFQKFAAAFEEYNEKLKGQPAAWREVNSRISELARLQQLMGVAGDKAWSNATKAALDYEKVVATATKAEKSLGGGMHNAAAAIKKMASEGKAFTSSLFDAVKFTTKLGTLGLGGGLVGGALGLFSLDDLANSVLGTTKTAAGLGLTSGQLNSFQVNMQQYAGLNVLQGAAQAQVSPSQAGYLATLGINPIVAANEPSTKVAAQEIMALNRAWKANPSMSNPAAIAAQRLGFSDEDIRRVGTANPAALRRQIAAVDRDAGALGWSQKVAQEWSDFSIQMQKAGKLIQTALIDTLVPLTPQLTQLSKEVASFITGLEKSGEVKQWVNDFATGIKDFAEWMKTADFKKDMQDASQAVKEFVGSAAKAAEFMYNLVGDKKKAGSIQGWYDALVNKQYTPGQLIESAGSAAIKAWKNQNVTSPVLPGGVTDDVVAGIAKVESNNDPNAVNKKSGAMGLMQLMPAAWVQYGSGNPFNAQDSKAAGKRYLNSDLLT